MKTARKSGKSRRLIEYILPCIAILLVGLLLWSLSVINKNEEPEALQSSSESVAEGAPVGSLSEIELSLSKEAGQENTAQQNQTLGDEYNVFVAAADDFGGAYDESTMTSVASDFCGTLPATSKSIQEKFDAKQAKLSETIAALHTYQSSRPAEIKQRVDKIRADNDAFQQRAFELFLGRLPEEDRQKYQTYQEALAPVIAERRQVNDQRHAEFWQKIDAFIEQRVAKAQAAANDLNTSVDRAVTAAEKSCKQSSKKITAGNLFIETLKSARLNYAEIRRQDYGETAALQNPIMEELNNSGVRNRQNCEQKLSKIRPQVELEIAEEHSLIN